MSKHTVKRFRASELPTWAHLLTQHDRDQLSVDAKVEDPAVILKNLRDAFQSWGINHLNAGSYCEIRDEAIIESQNPNENEDAYEFWNHMEIDGVLIEFGDGRPDRHEPLCDGVQACAIGSLYLAAGIPAFLHRDGASLKVHMFHTGAQHRYYGAEFIERHANRGLKIALEALDEAAIEYADEKGMHLHSEHVGVEALFEGNSWAGGDQYIFEHGEPNWPLAIEQLTDVTDLALQKLADQVAA